MCAVASAPGGQCLSLADYVAVTGTRGDRGRRAGRRAVHVAFAPLVAYSSAAVLVKPITPCLAA